jgi:hypothetical protein
MNTGQDLKEAEVGIMLDQGWPLPAPIEEGSPMMCVLPDLVVVRLL